jgi:hypothetical protein
MVLAILMSLLALIAFSLALGLMMLPGAKREFQILAATMWPYRPEPLKVVAAICVVLGLLFLLSALYMFQK